MSISDLDVKQKYNGNGVTTSFAIPFAFISDDSEETKVYLVNENVDPVTETLQTEGALQDYTLSGASPPGTPFNTHVVFNTPPPSTRKVLIVRKLALTQPEDIDATTQVDLSTIELAADRNLALIQQLDEMIHRAPKFRQSYTAVTDPLLPEPVAGMFLKWNADEDGLENATPVFNSSGGSIGLPSSSTDNAIVRWDGSNADTVQDSLVTIDDSGNISTPGTLTAINQFDDQQAQGLSSGQTGQSISGFTIDSTEFTDALFLVTIKGTSYFTMGFIMCLWNGSSWLLSEGPRSGTQDSLVGDGISFSITTAGTVGSIKYTSDSSDSGRIVSWKKVGFYA